MTNESMRSRLLSFLTLFSSLSTLLCCALPAFLVALGAGSVMAGLLSIAPQLIIVSRHKPAIFIFAGIMLSLSAMMQWRNRYAACPADPIQAKTCLRLRKWSVAVFFISLGAYLIGIFFTFFAKYFI